MSSVSSKSGKIHGVSVAAATCSPASTKSRQRVSQPISSPGLSRSNVAQVLRRPAPSRPRAVEVDHGGDVHRDHPGELLVGHLDGVLDPVVERVRPGRAERRLVGVEDHLHGLGADGVDRDLPAGLVRPADGLGQVGRSQLKTLPQPLSRWIFSPWTRRRSPTGPGSRSAYQSPRNVVAGVQGEVGVDAERQGVVGGQARRARRGAPG